MKKFLSLKGLMVLVLVLVAALGSSTVMADRQGGGSEAASMESLAGASIVTSALCAESQARETPSQVTVWGSGFGEGELVLLSLVKSADNAQILFSGSVNEAGAFEILTQYANNPKSSNLTTMAKYPGAGLYTLEALGTSGRIATAPLQMTDDKCS
mgnify:CR=1 FL=1|jgi:hypothetical protein